MLAINKIYKKVNIWLMIKMAIINRKGLKKELARKGMRVGKKVLEFYVNLKEREIKEDVEKIARNAKLSGRKTVRKEDVIS